MLKYTRKHCIRYYTLIKVKNEPLHIIGSEVTITGNLKHPTKQTEKLLIQVNSNPLFLQLYRLWNMLKRSTQTLAKTIKNR